jgi:hypothetical protein
MTNAGGVLSTFRVTLVVAELPKLSTAVPVMTWFAPLVETVTGGVQLTIVPEGLEQVNVTTTLVLFQPLAFGDGAAFAVMVGLLFNVTVALADAVFPAWSCA